MITSPGIGSGLDVNSIVDGLMAIERRPLDALEAKKADYETQLSAYGQLRSSVSSFQDVMSDLDSISDFKLYTATSSDSKYFTATASSTASTGTYDIKVNNLAEAHKMGSASFADKDTTTVGNAGDTMTVTIGSNSFTVTIGGQTLEQVRDAVNSASDALAVDSDSSNDVDVTASIVQQDSSNYYLTLTSDDTGTANAMSLVFKDSGGSTITDPLTMSTTNSAEDSSILIDATYTITRSSNTITDGIEGVTLNLVKEDTTNTYNLTINRDTQAVTAKVQAFVDAYNSLQKTMSDLSDGDLEGDGSLMSMERRLRDVLNTTPSNITSQYSYLADVGVTIQKDGTMVLDGDALNLANALAADFNGVAELFGNDNQGYAYRLKALADDFVKIGGNGVIEAREDGLNARIDSAEDRIATMELRMVLVEQRYRDQFMALDVLMGQLTNTSNFLTQQLARL